MSILIIRRTVNPQSNKFYLATSQVVPDRPLNVDTTDAKEAVLVTRSAKYAECTPVRMKKLIAIQTPECLKKHSSQQGRSGLQTKIGRLPKGKLSKKKKHRTPQCLAKIMSKFLLDPNFRLTALAKKHVVHHCETTSG